MSKKLAIVVAVIYTMIMGIGMAISNFVFHFSYGTPQMMYVIVFFEIANSILCYVLYKKYYNNNILKHKMKLSLWFLPFLIIIIYIISQLIMQGQFKGNIPLFLLIVATTILVGFSEELTYRGIILEAFGKNNVLVGIFVSAIAFSLMHSVNIFAGLPMGDLLYQLKHTFIVGLVFGALVVILENIIPVMIYHFIWDMSLISMTLLKVDLKPVIEIEYWLKLIIIIPMLIYIAYKKGIILKKRVKN